MDNAALREAARSLSTAVLFDACLRAKTPFDLAPAGIRPLRAGMRVAGRALPARHFGSVDVFLEAMEAAAPGDVLVVDNGGRLDEACVGDLTILEAQASGCSAVVVWGAHRDTTELLEIGFSVWSYASLPAGPRRLDARDADALDRAGFGAARVTRETAVFADDDGVLFVPVADVAEVCRVAAQIFDTERRQADRVRGGETLRAQLDFAGYLTQRQADPTYTLRTHLRRLARSIEE